MEDHLLRGPFALSCEALEVDTPTYEGSICGDNPHERRLYTRNSDAHLLWVLPPVQTIKDLPRYRQQLVETVCWGCTQFSIMLEDSESAKGVTNIRLSCGPEVAGKPLQ